MKLNKETVYRVDDDTLICGYNAVTIWANAYAKNFPKARVVEVPKVWRKDGKRGRSAKQEQEKDGEI